jgi:DEAD/DEAH box helicase domain-containing protein
MLHQGILPHHTNWNRFLSNLRFVVIDEIHTYRGVFGSHFANLMRRLKRICNFYNAWPQFVLTSATIGNPQELAHNLIEMPVTLIDQDGSPRGESNFVLYNPPFVDEKIGIRKSSIETGVGFTQKLINADHQTLVFAQTRRTVEMLLTYLRYLLPPEQQSLVRGYRSGYLKSERREIEQALRSGELRAVFSTSALELGIDIGGLDAVLLIGFPGSIATTHQRIGRAGRKQQASLAILIATNDAMDQYLANHPEYLLENNPEQALIDPQNFVILLQHIRCAAFELPFTAQEHFGDLDPSVLKQFLDFLSQSQILNQQGEEYFWVAEQYPAAEVSLRSSTPDIVSLQVVDEKGQRKLIGQLDANSASWFVHKDAIYLHEAEMYEVLDLDLQEGICTLKPSQADYFTIPVIDTQIIEHKVDSTVEYQSYSANYGDLQLEIIIPKFQKKRWFTNELVGAGDLDMPPRNLQTTGFWLNIKSNYLEKLRQTGSWSADPNAYGSNWTNLRQKILNRDQNTCRACGKIFPPADLHVHHIRPFRTFSDPDLANLPSNLVTLCPACHHQAEANVRVRSGLAGAGYALRSIAPLLIMCDREDVSLLTEARSVLNDNGPAILIYDNIPGGLGLSRKLFERRIFWIDRAIEMIKECQCESGCPACVGPVGEPGYGGKKEALELLEGFRSV